MKTDRDFSPTTPDEVRDYAFDYANDMHPLFPTEVLASAVFSIALESTEGGAEVDGAPADRKSGSATIAENAAGDMRAAVQRISGCVAGNKYRVTCLATTSRGQVLELYAYLVCRAAN